MIPFTSKTIGHIQSVYRFYSDICRSFGEVSAPCWVHGKDRESHLYLEKDVQMLWDQLQAARQTIDLQNKAIESILTAQKILKDKMNHQSD